MNIKEELSLLRKLAEEYFQPQYEPASDTKMIHGYYCPICDESASYIESVYKTSKLILTHTTNCYWHKKNVKHLISETDNYNGYPSYNFTIKKLKINDVVKVQKEVQINNPDFSVDWSQYYNE